MVERRRIAPTQPHMYPQALRDKDLASFGQPVDVGASAAFHATEPPWSDRSQMTGIKPRRASPPNQLQPVAPPFSDGVLEPNIVLEIGVVSDDRLELPVEALAHVEYQSEHACSASPRV